MNKYTFGADPELFIYGTSPLGIRVFPAYLYFPETGKNNCFMMQNGGVHSDNVMLELNPNPAESFRMLLRNISELQHDALEIIRMYQNRMNTQSAAAAKAKPITTGIKGANAGNLRLLAMSSISIDESIKDFYLAQPRFKEFGCEPDFNAYLMDMNSPPELPDTVRMAGGHIMISAPDERLHDFETVCRAVRWMDILVSSALHLSCTNQGLGDYYAEMATRRKFYGKAGSFRPKKFGNGVFGIEYRVPGPEWTCMNWESRDDMLFKSIETAMIASVENALAFKEPEVNADQIQTLINECSNDSMFELAEIASHV